MLTSLELFGFKSFAERTKFDFSPGITGVVGPNGSGKSNVVDAIKWILGDQSARSLRGKEMTDVIFNGAAGRKASQLAEATLTFDNSSGFLPIEAAQVQIGRRLWRSGDSEYLINKTPARLKDVRDLLAGTGAGSAAYNIIEQGRVDQILQANAASRRAIFEEAAGISRYKLRKAEALRRLERVDQNLVRLQDMVSELETRVVALRGQAARAAQFREVSDELRHLWQGFAADESRVLTRTLKTLDEEIAGGETSLTAIAARQQELEGLLGALEGEMSALDDRLREAERRVASNRETIAGHQVTIRHQSARKRELEGELVRLRRQRSVVAARVRESAVELERMRSQVAAQEEEFSGRSAEFERFGAAQRSASQAVESARAVLERERQRHLDQLRAVAADESRVAAAGLRLDALDATADEVRARRAEAEERVAARRTQWQSQRETCNAAAAEAEAAAAALAASESNRAALAEIRRRTRDVLAELRERRSAADARLRVLEEIDRRQQGLMIGVRDILHRAATLDYPPWNRIRGTVADLLGSADVADAALLEAALGPRAGLVVIEELDSLVEYVTSESCRISGRVGFIACQSSREDGAPAGPFDVFRIDLARLPDLNGLPGVVERADRLVCVDSEPQASTHSPLPTHSSSVLRLAEQLLADTWIVESLEDAFRLSAGTGRECRFVTRQGERLDPDGTLTVGTPRPEAAGVARASELRTLRNELLTLDEQMRAQEARLAELDELIASGEAERERLATVARDAADRCTRHENELARRADEVARAERELAAADIELTRIADQRARLEAERETARGDVRRSEEELAARHSALQAAEAELAESEQRLHALERDARAGQLDAAKHEERVAGLRSAFERLERDVAQRVMQQEEAERRYEAVAAKLREITLHVLNAGAALSEAVLAGEGLAQDVEALLDERTLLRGRRGRLIGEETALRQQRRELGDRQHQREIRRREARHQLEALAQRIADEYQVTLEEVVASGASAARHYAEQSPQKDEAGASQPSEPEEAEIALFLQIRAELDERIQRLRRKLRTMGAVDTESLTDLDDLEHRYALQHAQLQDLTEARSTLEEIVRRINAESRRLFMETFEEVRGHFRELFRKAFGGGDGDIVLEDPEDVLECGIEIVARPPGKELKSLSLLSGGEKALTAFALLLALFKTRPSPYCLLDEVDAPLDEANVGRLGALLEEFKGSTQFIVVTHKKPTMTIADVLYGVTMEQSGISKRMSVRFEDVNEHGEFVARESLRDAA